ncbi:MAG: methyltransferase domain-containing protein, partial [Chthoniobacteraceae bacterium]
MFFADRIRSIQKSDRVLEVGPGSSPHPRSDVLLERNFDTSEAAAQRGYTGAPDLKKQVVFYEGGRFPFEDGEFDYVICSHVLEHVDDAPAFVSELSRVAPRGYLEFPTIYYEYIYNFRVHQNFLHFDGNAIRWMSKGSTALPAFLPVQKFLYNSLLAGFDELIVSLPDCFFEGFEWNETIPMVEV